MIFTFASKRRFEFENPWIEDIETTTVPLSALVGHRAPDQLRRLVARYPDSEMAKSLDEKVDRVYREAPLPEHPTERILARELSVN